MISFNIKDVPFSSCGSYISISYMDGSFNGFAGKPGVYLRNIHGDAAVKEVFLIEPVCNSMPVSYELCAVPGILKLVPAEGEAELCVSDPKTLRIRGRGCGLRLTSNWNTAHDNAIEMETGRWLLNTKKNRISYMLRMIKGLLRVNAHWDGLRCENMEIYMTPDPISGMFELSLHEFRCSWSRKNASQDFDKCVKDVQKNYESFLEKMPRVPKSLAKARKLAAYIKWSCIVAPEGHLKYPAMLMSKNWMTNVYSWDHCFNAIALSSGYPQAAWGQFKIFFDVQDESGALPDFVSDCTKVWNYSKPPIHGWTLKKLMENMKVSTEMLCEVYRPLCKWTDWWFEYMDEDDDSIPQYNHGNDSGWDNSTVFLQRPPIESPDLAAFLIIQMEVLGKVAGMLGYPDEERSWAARAEELLGLFKRHFVRDGRLYAYTVKGHVPVKSDSLLLFIPLVLGRKLPEEILRYMVDELRGNRFLTEYGLATEATDSNMYTPDGYWRGPIWAPSTMLIVDGLMDIGERKLAEELVSRFAKLIQKSGFAENYNAITGEGLRDRAYTWTASVFLILAGGFYKNNITERLVENSI